MTKKKVAVLGSGQVSQILASGFLKHGYDVVIGSAHISKLNDWKSKNPQSKVVSREEAAKWGELIVLAVKGTSAEEVVKPLASDLAGKIVIDATNPVAEKPPVNGLVQFFTTLNDSLMEHLQKLAPKANFVKAFNSVGNLLMVNPSFPGGKPTMFICGNSKKAKKEVAAILVQFGWEPADFGRVESARALEPLCILWCIPGMIDNEWMHAFKLLKM